MKKRNENLQSSGLFKIYLIFVGATPMLSTDFYLPALPSISAYYGTDDAMTNLTMILFTVTLAVSSLLWGPISDKSGRKPVIALGAAAYFLGSLLCVFAPTIEALIVFRVLQAVGGGSAVMVSSAFVKDVFDENHQERILSVMQGMMLIGPAVAPTAGALMMKIADWHGIFILMTGMGAVILAGSLYFGETLREPLTVSVFSALGRLRVVLRNRRFALIVIIFAIPAIPLMAFINASPYIFQNRFGLSEQIYSLFFAASALSMMGGSFAYPSLAKRFGRTAIAYVCLGVIAVCGVGVLLVGSVSPTVFILFIIPSSFAGALSKPLSIFLGLNAQESDTGSASSLIGFASLMMSSLGMALLAFFGDYLMGVGVLYLAFGAAAVTLFAVFLRKV
ncbi:MAG: MFS transporter [Clostridiales Family XIII bacterium]|jgi:DHA1 family bicyclomycin/chloramphenicol resistance-like MFS transporter|nr:MFS transporter [Clostridiales Family XIII bacterium]